MDFKISQHKCMIEDILTFLWTKNKYQWMNIEKQFSLGKHCVVFVLWFQYD